MFVIPSEARNLLSACSATKSTVRHRPYFPARGIENSTGGVTPYTAEKLP